MSRYTPPKRGEGWDAFQDEDNIAAMIDSGVIDTPEEYGFDSHEELVNFVEGHEYAPDRGKVAEIDCADPTMAARIHQPKDEQDEYDPMQPPKCHRCLDERTERGICGGMMYKDEGADIDPNMLVHESDEEEQSAIVGADTKTVYQTVASCPDHDDVWFSFETRRHD